MPVCGSHYRDDELDERLRVCRQCGHHFPVAARERIAQLADPGTFVEEDAELRSADPLDFFDLRPYAERLAEAELKTGLGDAIVTGRAAIDGAAVPSSRSWTSASWAARWAASSARSSRARASRPPSTASPLVSVTASGGARMQEGILALMQLPKTVCAVEDLHDAGCAMITVLAHPTTGGVLASFASARRRDDRRARGADVVRRAARRRSRRRARSCPRTSACAESNLRLRPRRRHRPAPRAPAVRSARLLRLFGQCRVRGRAQAARAAGQPQDVHAARRRAASRASCARLEQPARAGSAAEPSDEEIWRSVELARHQERPYTLDYVERILDDWFELHGDRGRADDPAIVAGLGKPRRPHGRADRPPEGPRHQGARRTATSAWPHPEGYRKAMRLMELADRLGLPLITPRRHARRLPGRRRRAARAGRHDRPLAGADGPARRPDGRVRDRRGRLRRRGRVRRRRPGADAGERDLLGDLARGLRDDPLAGRGRRRRRPPPRSSPTPRTASSSG